MIGITGKRSAITQRFVEGVDEQDIIYGTTETLPLDLDEYLLCAGVLFGKSATAMSDAEALETFRVNFLDVVRFCDRVFAANERARICVIGSESGIRGSYDTVYAGAKAALHLYVERKKLAHPAQHLVCIAPWIIEDAGMTQRRTDLEETIERGKAQHRGRWLRADEVARAARFALAETAFCNSVLRMNGGN